MSLIQRHLCMLVFKIILGLLLLTKLSTANNHECTRPGPAQLLEIYGAKLNYSRSIITNSSEAQQLFNLGMLLAADYNQPEARQAFRAALSYDKLCVMCWWGLAYARGPFQNKPAIPPPSNPIALKLYPHYSQQDRAAAVAAITNAALLLGLVDQEHVADAFAASRAALLNLADPDSTTAAAGGSSAGQPRPRRLMRMLTRCRTSATAGPQAHGVAVNNGTANGTTGNGTAEAASGRQRLLDQDPAPATPPPPSNTTGVPSAPPPSQSSSNATEASPPSPSPLQPSASASFPPPPPSSSGSSAEGEGEDPEPPRREPVPDPQRGPDLLTLERHYVAAMFDRLATNAAYGPEWEAAERRFVRDMERIALCAPNDTDAVALAAEALANLTPWNFTDNTTHVPYNTTRRVLLLLDAALKRNPLQPLALHLKIHVTETLPTGPGNDTTATLGEAAADALRDLAPSMDHLQHMPSHNYVRVGRWLDAAEANVASLRASVRASNHCLSSLYPEHNSAMGVFAASMAGDLDNADTYARVVRELPRFVRDAPLLLGYQWTAPLLVWTRFGCWDLIATSPPPPLPPNATALAALLVGSWNATEAGGKAGNASASAPVAGAGAPHGFKACKKLPADGGGGYDVESDTRLDPVLRTDPGPRVGPLGADAYDPEGAEYAVVVWHFSRLMSFAAQLTEQQHIANISGSAAAAGGHTVTPGAGSGAGKGAGRRLRDLGGTGSGAGSGSGDGGHSGSESGSGSGGSGPTTDEQAAALVAAAAGAASGEPGVLQSLIEHTRQQLDAALEALKKAQSLVPEDVPTPPGSGLGIVIPGYKMLSWVLRLVGEARVEVAVRRNLTNAEDLLRAAVEIEDKGGYMEPPRLGHQPVRQCLGALLLHHGQVGKAIRVYLEDLERFPRNPWSLLGLSNAMRQLEKEVEKKASSSEAGAGPHQGSGDGGGGGGGGHGDPGDELSPEMHDLYNRARAAEKEATEGRLGAARPLEASSSCPAFFPPPKA